MVSAGARAAVGGRRATLTEWGERKCSREASGADSVAISSAGLPPPRTGVQLRRNERRRAQARSPGSRAHPGGQRWPARGRGGRERGGRERGALGAEVGDEEVDVAGVHERLVALHVDNHPDAARQRPRSLAHPAAARSILNGAVQRLMQCRARAEGKQEW